MVLNNTSYVIGDSGQGGACGINQTKYVGLAWCAGNLVVNTTTGAMTCDGGVLGNAAQSDSFTFDVGIRTIYIADKDKFNPSNIGGLTGAFRQYSYGSLNGFAPTEGLTGFDDFWKDPTGKIRERRKREAIEGYKARQIFYPPYKGKAKFVLNSEELATIYHFPGSVVATPTFERVPSKKSEAPFNLPI